MINKDELKKELVDIYDIHRLVTDLGGSPRPVQNGVFVSQTICHNDIGKGSYKLYYYNNTTLFHCYSGCDKETFDIYELVQKVKSRETGNEWSLPKCVHYVAHYFGFDDTVEYPETNNKLADWFVLSRYKKEEETERLVQLNHYPDKILRNLPFPHIKPWEEEGITYEVCRYCGIVYDPIGQAIIIPHYDDEGQLIGIRQRTLIKEDADVYGKYRPARLNNMLYSHPLSFALYGLNLAKDNIKSLNTAIVFEGEKSVLKYMSYFGIDNNIAVACCGSAFSQYQFELLKKYNIKNIIIAFDKEGQDDKKSKYVKKFYNIAHNFGNKVNISFIYDKDGEYLDYKQSPIDAGAEVFLKLYQKRIYL